MHDTARPVVVVETSRRAVEVVTHRDAGVVTDVMDGIKRLRDALAAHPEAVGALPDAVQEAWVSLEESASRVFVARPVQQPGGHVVVDLSPWLTAPASPAGT